MLARGTPTDIDGIHQARIKYDYWCRILKAGGWWLKGRRPTEKACCDYPKRPTTR
jgi:hypothetical protein